MSYYLPDGLRKRFLHYVLTTIVTTLVFWAVGNQIEENYVSKKEFNKILEQKLKELKVNEEGRLIVAP